MKTKEDYVENIKNLQMPAEEAFGNNQIFQQVDDAKHMLKLVIVWLSKDDINI